MQYDSPVTPLCVVHYSYEHSVIISEACLDTLFRRHDTQQHKGREALGIQKSE